MSARTHKTAPLLNLLSRSGDSQIENPIINDEFKQEVIHVKPDTRKKERSPTDTDSSQGINIIAELVDEWLPIAVSRFKCCGCDVCIAEMTVDALGSIPPEYVDIDSPDGLKKMEDNKEKFRSQVIKKLVSIVLKNKVHPKH